MDRVGNKIGALRFSPTQPSATLNSPPPLFQLTSNHEEGWGLHSTQNPVSASGHWPSIWILIRLWPQIMEEISKAGRACVVQISVPLCCKQCWRAIHLKCLTLFTVKILKRLPILGQWSQFMVQCKFYSVFKGRFHRIFLFLFCQSQSSDLIILRNLVMLCKNNNFIAILSGQNKSRRPDDVWLCWNVTGHGSS